MSAVGRVATIALALASTTGLAACADGPGPNEMATPADAIVVADDNTFEPETLTIAAGTEVTFLNEDDIRHGVVADDGDTPNRLLDADGGLIVTVFNEPGVTTYHCNIHPEMTGTIEVLD